jgi:hypothetical protein
MRTEGGGCNSIFSNAPIVWGWDFLLTEADVDLLVSFELGISLRS